jgi:hypothetical protein
MLNELSEVIAQDLSIPLQLVSLVPAMHFSQSG